MYKIALTVILLLVLPSPAIACSCMLPVGSQSNHVRRAYKQADAVFSAYGQSIHYREVDGHRIRMVKLRILQVWKGDLQPNTWIDVASDDTGLMGCSFIAEVDRALMVYVSGKQPYSLASCSLTGPLERATDDVPLLNKLSRRGR